MASYVGAGVVRRQYRCGIPKGGIALGVSDTPGGYVIACVYSGNAEL
ncbi:hypothetical protein HMPREF1861_02109 [Corynebacterium kroppenstedtii]|nr:hypothetical protein HMPREF1861_02109 [Corynebacterium kroppenstedtii]